ncbi:hypothetical protein [Kineosporia sp. R_H_3]|uniref:hypothetical protein n=1 Tax=Kineosporia sp. R_H_3 TaxID=1961848 RepID=UPI000B4B76E5|nr:hypothetical protein [Kineosporia sp. R_H_3]
MTVASLLLLAAVSVLALGFYRELPPVRRKRARALVALVVAVVLLGAAGALAWVAPAVTGWVAEAAVALAVLAGASAGGPVATALLRLATNPGAAPGTPSPADPTLLHGGAWIGVLERLAVTSSVLLGWPEGVAVVLAVKGLGRYPELRAPAAAERFIIGTFGSVLWAVASAGAGWALLH